MLPGAVRESLYPSHLFGSAGPLRLPPKIRMRVKWRRASRETALRKTRIACRLRREHQVPAYNVRYKAKARGKLI